MEEAVRIRLLFCENFYDYYIQLIDYGWRYDLKSSILDSLILKIFFMDPHNEIRCYSHYVTINLNMQNLIYVQKTRESQSYDKENR